MNGTYAFVYSGGMSVAIGFFIVHEQQISGADCGGGRYEGTIVEDPSSGNLRLIFDHFAPAGIAAGRGAPPGNPGRRLALTMPPAFGGGEPVRLEVPPDVVTMMVKRVPDRWAGYSGGFSIWPERREPAEREVIGSQLLGRLLN
jgi:hypothetical protein